MVGPGGGVAITRQSIDPALGSALVRAEAWKRRLIGGDGATLETIADEEKLNQSYASRMLRVAFLAPDLKQAVLDGTAPEALSLYAIMHRGLPLDWDEQRAMFAARRVRRSLIRSISFPDPKKTLPVRGRLFSLLSLAGI